MPRKAQRSKKARTASADSPAPAGALIEKREKSAGSKIWDRMAKAARSLQQNPVLVIPDFIMFMLTYIMTVMLYRIVGMQGVMQSALQQGGKSQMLRYILASAVGAVSINWAQVLVALSGFVFVTFILGVGAETIRFGLIKQCAEGKRASFMEAWKTRNGYFWKIVIMKILIYLLFSGAILFVAFLSLIAYSLGPNIAGLSLGWVALLLGFLVSVLLMMGLLLRYAILFFENASPKEAIRLSFRYLRSMTASIVYAWAIISLVSILAWLLAAFAGVGMAKLQAAADSVTLVYFISFMTSFIAFVFKTLYSLWADLFVFNTYLHIRKDA